MIPGRKRQEGVYQPLLSSSPPLHARGPLAQQPPLARPRGFSPGTDRAQRHPSLPRPRQQLLATGAQGPGIIRQKDKWVPLPDDDSGDEPTGSVTIPFSRLSEDSATQPSPPLSALNSGLFEDLPAQQALADAAAKRGRITLYCNADSYDRKKLDEQLRASFPSSAIKSYPDVFYLQLDAGDDDSPGSDIYVFDYGVVAFWGLDKAQEAHLLASITTTCAIGSLDPSDVEVDEFTFNYSALERPHIANDTVTLHRRAGRDHKVKLAISYALSQSTKLSMHERRVQDMVLETKDLPEGLAETGKVHMEPGTIAKLIGKVFIQKSAVNLLSSVLDTPEFFWREVDTLQGLYERICEYLELDARVEVLNARFAVLQDMLDMLRDHEHNQHATRLEWIVIILIFVEVVVGLLELLGLFGFIKED